MKNIIPLLWIFLLLTSCYSNSQDFEKIWELANNIAEKDVEIMELKFKKWELEREIFEQEENIIQYNNIIIDILKWEWFAPGYAPRKIFFNIDDTYKFNEDDNKVLSWEYKIDWSNIILENWIWNIELNLSWWDWEDINFYLSNDDWEYFVKNNP